MSQLKYALSVGMLFLLFANLVNGQSAARPDRGIHATGSYVVSDIESIDLSTGNVNLSIPLASLPPIAGGKLSLTLNATYNSKLWDVTRRQVQEIDPPYNYVVDLPQVGNSGGWSLWGGYSLITRDSHEDFDWVFPNANDPDFNYLSQHPAWHKRFVVTPDGAEHELRPLGQTPYPGDRPYLKGYFEDNPNTSGQPLSYYTMDGSYLWVKIYPTNHPSGIFAEIYARDGTIVRFASGLQRIIDTNGNEIRIWADTEAVHYMDWQTGREVKVTSPSAGISRVSYQTVGGTWMNIDVVWGTTQVRGKTFMTRVPKINGGDCEAPTSLGVVGVDVIREIIFPQTEPAQPSRRFTFTYNSDTTEAVNLQWWPFCESSLPITTSSRGLGAIKQMTMPSGATVNYTYELDEAHELSDPLAVSRDRIISKSITHDGVTDTWTYNFSSVVNPDGSTVTEGAFPRDVAYPSSSAGLTGFDGLSFGTNYSNKVLIQRKWQRLVFSGALDTILGVGTVTFNPVVVAEYTSLLDDTPSHNPVKMSAKTYEYDYNGNVTQTTEYDWFDPALVTRDAQGVPTGVPASAIVLRVTSNSYYNQASTASSANVYAKRSVSTGAPLILNATQQSTVGPAIVQLSYDSQPYGVAPTAGNLTMKKVWDDLDSKWITTSSTYGLYGNVATATDARGKVTQFFYDDATHALPTRVVVDPQNGTGTQTATTAYDFSTGLVTSQTDVNGQVTTIDYTNQLLSAADPFGRPGITRSPTININATDHRRSVTTTYLDSTRQIIVETDLNAENDKLLKTRTTTDMLGRPVLSESTEDGTNYAITVRNAYLDMGRVTLTSGPMRSTAAPTDSWTRVTKDIAGRVTEVATFGGATQPVWSGTAGAFTGAVTTAYNANFTTVTDQAGKVRRSMTDALGRLVRVDEPDAAGNLGPTASPVQKTDYEYDVFGNLKKVIQGIQERTFTYDSLSRLRTAVNPESGTVTYQYDDNANLIVKTDARGVSTHYDYDSLNRVTRRWYNGSSSTSQLTHNVPALPSGVGATNEAKFYYDSQTLPTGAPLYSRGSAVGRLVAQTYGSGSNGDYYAYDVLGRQTLKIQQTGAVNYQVSAGYTLAGAVSSLTYPSGHTINNTFDQAGRLTIFSGNLGDGTTRTYSTGSVYSAVGGLLKEQFGTNTPVYHKLRYNSRAQLCDVRASNVNDEWGGELGVLANYYSTPFTHCGDGADNNGNVLMTQTRANSSVYFEDRYTYDSLNRLTAVNEYLNGTTYSGKQEYDYDRWGNRTLKSTSTLGMYKEFTVNTANNRLGVPSGQPPSITMNYDNAGNLIHDTYTGAGNRTYDGESKITSAWGGNNQAQLYGYDASGQRIKRTVDGVTTWQVYGFGGELLAEYPANGATATPQKEYGYRNGQLLIVAQAPLTNRTNVALSENGATATASSYLGAPYNYYASYVNDGQRTAANENIWLDSTYQSFPDWVQIDFNGTKTINEIDVVTQQDSNTNPVEPTLDMTFSSWGITAFEVQYWNGTSWVTVPNGSVTGNNKVWRQFTFANITTSKIRVTVNGGADNAYSRVVEVEAWSPPSTNYALPANGGSATASSYLGPPQNYYPSYVNDGQRTAASDNIWLDSTYQSFPDWVQIDFNGTKTINEIDVVTQQDSNTNPVEPTLDMTFSNWGITAFEVQYWNGTSWATVPNGSVTGNNKVWRQFTFPDITTSKIRVTVNGGADNAYSRVVEVEAWGAANASSPANINWLVTDHLGTPRIILDQTGTAGNVKRHDYLPFGEELSDGDGGRTAAMGYAAGDGVRQQFTSKERDVETGLDYFGARYYASIQGRFTSPDLPLVDQLLDEPQSWNLYSYVVNNPQRYVDPYGYWKWTPDGFLVWEDENDTWETLGIFIGADPKALEQFFQGVSLGPETVLDITNFNNNRGKDPKLNIEWTEFDEREFRINQMRAEFQETADSVEFVPPMGGGLRTITAAEYFAISRAANASRILRQNLVQAGAVVTEGQAAHHIVAAAARPAGFARSILGKFGININAAENGLFLPAAVHARIHTSAYYKAVNRLLAQAQTREEALAVLEYIKSEIRKGTFP